MMEVRNYAGARMVSEALIISGSGIATLKAGTADGQSPYFEDTTRFALNYCGKMSSKNASPAAEPP